MGARCVRAEDVSGLADPDPGGEVDQFFAEKAVLDLAHSLSCRCARHVAVEQLSAYELPLQGEAALGSRQKAGLSGRGCGSRGSKGSCRSSCRSQLQQLREFRELVLEEPFAELEVEGPLEGESEGSPLCPQPLRLKPSFGTSEILEPVTLNIYNIGTSPMGKAVNKFLRHLGTGAFHCGVEVFGQEWSYSDTEDGMGLGIFYSRPRRCEGHTYSESLNMGCTDMTKCEVSQLIHLLISYWPVAAYNTLTNNCCHFCNELCQRLRVASVPGWVMNLAGAGALLAETGNLTCCREVAREVIGPGADNTCCTSAALSGPCSTSYHL